MLLALAVTICVNGLTAEAVSAADRTNDQSTHAVIDRALVAVGQRERVGLDWSAPSSLTPAAALPTAAGR